jgi:hypothetical protein
MGALVGIETIEQPVVKVEIVPPVEIEKPENIIPEEPASPQRSPPSPISPDSPDVLDSPAQSPMKPTLQVEEVSEKKPTSENVYPAAVLNFDDIVVHDKVSKIFLCSYLTIRWNPTRNQNLKRKIHFQH